MAIAVRGGARCEENEGCEVDEEAAIRRNIFDQGTPAVFGAEGPLVIPTTTAAAAAAAAATTSQTLSPTRGRSHILSTVSTIDIYNQSPWTFESPCIR